MVRTPLTRRGEYLVATAGAVLFLGAIYALLLVLSAITGVTP